MDVRVRPAQVDAEPAHQVRATLLNGVDCPLHEPRVGACDAPVTIRVDRNVGSVAILMAAIARGAPDPAIVEGRTEPRVNARVEGDAILSTMPARDLGEHELQ